MDLAQRQTQFKRLLKKYIFCVDVEATCSDDNSVPREEMEVIEFGGVLLDRDSMEILERVEFFIKPTLHTTLTPFCKELTHITQEQVDNGQTYLYSLNQMRAFQERFGRDLCWCSWGAFDKNIFLQDGVLHGLSPLLEPHNHFNLKVWFSNLLGKTKGFGLDKAIQHQNLEFVGQHHRALSDAENVAQILKTMV